MQLRGQLLNLNFNVSRPVDRQLYSMCNSLNVEDIYHYLAVFVGTNRVSSKVVQKENFLQR
ncbi:hypothetical protein O3M35_008487 [Rhynocoris fuscipes]|uniref:Uncharacterized protein n=1 Tax=Rhynocoris fuscipes TaxID=488301 RepID=A0AAW1D8U1_9HEMI